jgi:4'-phosphopantetheinyl transferase
MFSTLMPRELHLWWVDICRPSEPVGVLAQCLAPDERQRSERFVRETDRHRFVVSHAAVRRILGHYLSIPPDRVEITIRPGGRPEVAPSDKLPSLRYSLSHSGERALVGVTCYKDVGVDVEHVRPLIDADNIVERYFSAGERAVWRSLPADEQLAAFFRCWTRKEAYLKAQGVGLSAGLDQVEVSLAPGEPACLLRVSNSTDLTTRWQMYDIPASTDYMAACVVDGGIDGISVYDWPLLSVTQPEPALALDSDGRRPG